MDRTSRRLDIHHGAAAFVLLVAAVIAVLPSSLYLSRLATDDALYYLTIARNIADGRGSTYDGGATRTNGYHPLWCWLFVPIALLFKSAGPLVYLWWAKLVVSVVVVAAAAVWIALVRRIFESPTAAAVFGVFLGGYWWSIYTLFGLMETPLVVLFAGLVLLAYLRAIREPDRPRKEAVLLGLMMAGAFLARLDSIFFLAACGSVYAFRSLRNGRIDLPLLTAGTVVLISGPYLAWNLISFGGIIPISGLIKTGTDLGSRLASLAVFWTDKAAKLKALIGTGGILAGVALLGFVLIVGRRELGSAWRRARVIAWIFPAAAAHYLYTAFLMTEGNVHWYQYLEYLSAYLAIALVAAAAEAWIKRRLRFIPSAAPAVAVFLLLGIFAAGYLPGRFRNDRARTVLLDVATWIERNIPEGSRIGMRDSGIVSFRSGRPAVSLNGLAGDRELLGYLRAGDIRGVIDRYGLKAVVTYVTEAEYAGLRSGLVLHAAEPVVQYGTMSGLGPVRYVVLAPEAFSGRPEIDPPIR